MTKADIIDAVHEHLGGYSKKEAAEVVDLAFETIKDALAGGGQLKVSGFGTFLAKEKGSRIGRNPQTGDALTIDARRVLTFRPSQALRDAVNSRG